MSSTQKSRKGSRPWLTYTSASVGWSPSDDNASSTKAPPRTASPTPYPAAGGSIYRRRPGGPRRMLQRPKPDGAIPGPVAPEATWVRRTASGRPRNFDLTKPQPLSGLPPVSASHRTWRGSGIRAGGTQASGVRAILPIDRCAGRVWEVVQSGTNRPPAAAPAAPGVFCLSSLARPPVVLRPAGARLKSATRNADIEGGKSSHRRARVAASGRGSYVRSRVLDHADHEAVCDACLQNRRASRLTGRSFSQRRSCCPDHVADDDKRLIGDAAAK